MQNLNGGYVMIDLNDTNNIYSRAKDAIGCGKPIMVFDDPKCYYADSIKLVDDDVVITKGGKTITINDANAVSSEGEITTHMWVIILYLADATIEDDVTLPAGKYLALLSNKYYKYDDTIENGKYGAFNSSYGYNGNTYNIFALKINNGTIDVYYDSGDMNNTITKDFNMKVYDSYQLF